MRPPIVVLFVAGGLAATAGLACSRPGPRAASADAGPSVVAHERRMPSDVPGVDIVVTTQAASGAYVAHTESGVPLTHPYAIERDAHKGLVHLHCVEGAGADQRVHEWSAKPGSFEKVISMRYDMDVLDRWDVLVSDTRLRFVHTTVANAGVFVTSDVYELPRLGSPITYKRALGALPEACAPDPLVLAEAVHSL